MRQFLDLRFDIAGEGLQPSAGSAAERACKVATDVYQKVNGLKGYRQQSQILAEDVKSLLDAFIVTGKGEQIGTEGRSKATSELERLLASIDVTFLRLQSLSLKEYARRGTEFEAEIDDYRQQLAHCFQLFDFKNQSIWTGTSAEIFREASRADALYVEEMIKLLEDDASTQSLLTDNLTGEAYFQQLNDVSSLLQDKMRASQVECTRVTEPPDIYWRQDQKAVTREKIRRSASMGVDVKSGTSVMALRASRKEVLPIMMVKCKVEDLRQYNQSQYHDHVVWVEIFQAEGSELELDFATPHYRNGNIMHFLSKQEDPATCDITKWLYQVATAIAFLHILSPLALHSSIQGENILLDDQMNARLSSPLFPNQTHESLSYESPYPSEWPLTGARWLAPEIQATGKPTKASAVWSFGITAVEVLTGHCPMITVKDHYFQVRYRDKKQPPPLRKNEYRLPRPTEPFCQPGSDDRNCLSPPDGYCSDGRRLDDAWASLVSCCFIWEPDHRADIEDVVENLKSMRQDL